MLESLGSLGRRQLFLHVLYYVFQLVLQLGKLLFDVVNNFVELRTFYLVDVSAQFLAQLGATALELLHALFVVLACAIQVFLDARSSPWQARRRAGDTENP